MTCDNPNSLSNHHQCKDVIRSRCQIEKTTVQLGRTDIAHRLHGRTAHRVNDFGRASSYDNASTHKNGLPSIASSRSWTILLPGVTPLLCSVSLNASRNIYKRLGLRLGFRHFKASAILCNKANVRNVSLQLV